jgi:hypothetical protein
MERHSHRGLLGLVFCVALLGVAGSSAVSPTSAFACTPTTNPDASKTCTDSQMVPCPTVFMGTTSGYSAIFIRQDALNITHQFSLACPGSGLSETFDPNASSPTPPSGERTARDDFTATCNLMGGCAGGMQMATFTVNYFDPSSGGGSTGGETPTLPPSASSLIVPPKVWVGPKQGEGEVPFDVEVEHLPPSDLTDWFLFAFLGAHPVKPKSRSLAAATVAKRVTIGTLSNVHLGADQKKGVMPLKLNGKGLKALRALGKLTVTAQGKFSNAAGSTPVTRKLKLVAKKK